MTSATQEASAAVQLNAARRKLEELKTRERELSAAFRSVLIDADDPEPARAERTAVRQAIGDLGAAIPELEARAEADYASDMRAYARTAVAAATRFDAAVDVLLAAMHDVDTAGQAMYRAAHVRNDPRDRFLASLVYDPGASEPDIMTEVLQRLTRRDGFTQLAPWKIAHPSLLTLAQSRANLIDWE